MSRRAYTTVLPPHSALNHFWHSPAGRALSALYNLLEGQNSRADITAASMPMSCAAINAGTPAGAMPAKVSEIERAIVTAGLANDVEAVNQ